MKELQGELPPLKSLRGFEAVARLESVRMAADELNLTHPAISHQIKMLEEHLGYPLFERAGRHIQLNAEGKFYYGYIRRALETLLEGQEALTKRWEERPFRVQAYITLSIKWLAGRLNRFRNLAPHIDLHLNTSGIHWEFDEDNADIAIIYSDKDIPDGYGWTSLFESQIFPVCSPKLINENSLTAAELNNFPLLIVNSESDFWNWDQWFHSAGVTHREGKGNLSVDTLAVALEMACAGEGIALVNGPVADGDLESGRLVKPVNHMCKGKGEWGLIYQEKMMDEPRAKLFADWVCEEAGNL
ncbi:LysR substrate-binding domain-containing protein [Curvivirga sp.]|uniref:LysR substrate-binding domain-containing protein n=1 Tax=Curvivirga sp. TaxID=2856848 RepID=UPI003B594849